MCQSGFCQFSATRESQFPKVSQLSKVNQAPIGDTVAPEKAPVSQAR